MRVLPTNEEMLEISLRARRIYDQDVAGELTDADYEQNVAIDVESGDWEVGALNDSMKRLRSRRPHATIFNIFHETPDARRFDWISNDSGR